MATTVKGLNGVSPIRYRAWKSAAAPTYDEPLCFRQVPEELLEVFTPRLVCGVQHLRQGTRGLLEQRKKVLSL